MCKTLSTRIAQKIAQKFAESNNEDIEFVATTLFTMNYTTFATARLSSLNQSTVYGILTVDMIFHIFGCYQIIKQQNHVEGATASAESNATMKRKVRYLVMSEFTEAIYPLAFGITFTMAYYGPNASLFRNIGNGYFGGKSLEVSSIFTESCFKYFVLIWVQWLSVEFHWITSARSIYFKISVTWWENIGWFSALSYQVSHSLLQRTISIMDLTQQGNLHGLQKKEGWVWFVMQMSFQMKKNLFSLETQHYADRHYLKTKQ